jgi:metal-responsive CopG/Arc/MetJ family transcriptional regulator
MHHKQHLAAADVIQRPPSVTITLQAATIQEVDRFIRDVGSTKGIRSRSDAIQFLLDTAINRYSRSAEPGDHPALRSEIMVEAPDSQDKLSGSTGDKITRRKRPS